MLVPNQMIEVAWMPTNREHYKSLGYKYTKCRDKIIVHAEELCPSSHKRVLVICDYCGDTIEKDYVNFLKERLNGKDCCKKCWSKKFTEYYQENYGVSNPFQLESIKEKSKETSLKKYGTERPCQSDVIKQKIAETNIDKYGNSCSLQNEAIKAKAEATCLQKYGARTAFDSKKIQGKIAHTIKEKYGVENVAHAPLVAEKIKQGNITKYGVPYTTQVPEVITKMRESLCKNGSIPTSKAEKAMCQLLREMYGVKNCQEGYPLGRIIMDCLVSIDDTLIDVEYDGWYWHKDKQEYDRRRNYYVIGKGYRVLRIKADKKDTLPSKKQIQEAIDYLVKDNHHLAYIDMNV